MRTINHQQITAYVNSTSLRLLHCLSINDSLLQQADNRKMDISLCIKKNNNFLNASVFPIIDGEAIAITLGVFNVIASIVNSVSSILIIVAILSSPRFSQAPSYVLLAIFTGCNLGMALIVQPLCFSAIFVVLSKDTPNNVCNLFFAAYASSNFMFSASIFTSLAIAVDRLLAVRLKISYKTVVTLLRVRLVFGCIMTGAILKTLITVFVTFTSQSILNSVEFAVCLLAITACYVVSYRALNILCRSVWVADQQSDQGYFSRNEVFKYKKVLKTMVIVLILSVLVYGPVIFYFMTFQTLLKTSSTSLHRIGVLVNLLTFIVAAIIPVVYIARMRDLKIACFRILRKVIPWCFPADIRPLETP